MNVQKPGGEWQPNWADRTAMSLFCLLFVPLACFIMMTGEHLVNNLYATLRLAFFVSLPVWLTLRAIDSAWRALK